MGTFDAHKNFAISTVATAPSPATSGTSLVVAGGGGASFPAVPFNAVIWPTGAKPTSANAEVVRVTAISTDTFTITRAQEGSGARTVIIGDQIMAASTSKTLTDVEGAAVGNLLINGGFDVWQRNTTFTTPNDDTFTADRWNCLQEANGAWTFSRSTTAPDGSLYSMKAVNVTLNNQCGFVYFFENIDAAKLFNKTVSASFQAQTTAAKVIANLRMAILSWTSTADVLTSDVVGTWAQDGTNPTWAANYTLENTPANFALANGAWTLFKSENFAIDTAGMTNIAVVIWVDDGTITAGDEFLISQVQLNIGPTAAPYVPKTYATELQACQRYCWAYSTAAGGIVGRGYATQTTNAAILVDTKVPMRLDTPVLTATGSDWQIADSVAAGIDATAISISGDPPANRNAVWLSVTVAGATQYRPYQLRGDSGGTRIIVLDAEL